MPGEYFEKAMSITMTSGWSADFSYDYFRQLLKAMQANFKPQLLSQAPRIVNAGKVPKIILRHDVDVSLKHALRMAEIETEFGIRATYMFIQNSPLYCLEEAASRDVLGRLISMGHEVGLHFDVSDDARNSTCEVSDVESQIDVACKQLEDVTGSAVESISFHRPLQQFLRGPLLVGGRTNAYADQLMNWYMSDSKGSWREGEPLPRLTRPEKPLLQLLIHPIWWGEKHGLPEDRLQELFTGETAGKSFPFVSAFDAALATTVPAVRRRIAHEETHSANQISHSAGRL